MDSGISLIIVFGLLFFICVICFFLADSKQEEELHRAKKQINEHLKTIQRLERKEQELERKELWLNKEIDKKVEAEKQQIEKSYLSKYAELHLKRCCLEAEKQQIEKREHILNHTVKSFLPFKNTATFAADINTIMYERAADYLENKSHPAISSAQIVRELKVKAHSYLQELKTLKYKLEFLTSTIPELSIYLEDEDESSLLELGEANLELDSEEVSYDRVCDYTNKEEYMRLSTTKRNQLAFDRWLSCVSNYWIGMIYELYIAQEIKRCHTYRSSHKVDSYGVRMGYNDLGRDIIYYADEVVYIIQCKCWSQKRLIREKTLCQTVGTAVEFEVQEELKYEQTPSLFLISPPPEVIPVIVTSTPLSDVAQRFAKHLKIKVITTHTPIEKIKYMVPLIKCNINNGNKIYHLPFDQQWHRTIIDESKGEFYAMTVKEAEEKGFRRAFRHIGGNQ